MPPQRAPQRGRGRGQEQGGGYRGGGGGGQGRGQDYGVGYRGGGGRGYQDGGGYRGGGGQGRGYQDAPRYQDDRRGGGGQRGGAGRGRGYANPGARQDRGGRGRYGGPPRDRGNQEYNPFPEGPGSHPKKNIKYKPADLGIEYKLSLSPSSSMPKSPGVGTLGKNIKLISNCFAMKKTPSGFVYHYDVDIFNVRGESTATGPEKAKSKKYVCLNTKRNRQVINKMLDTNPIFKDVYGAYDGKKNLICRKRLDIVEDALSCTVNLARQSGQRGVEENPDVFEVIVKPVRKKNSNDCSINLDTLHAVFAGHGDASQEAVMAMEIILRNGPCMRFTPVGRSFFYPPKEMDLHPLSGGLEIWSRYHQSVRLGEWLPIVNLDFTATAFYQAKGILEHIVDMFETTKNALGNMVLSDRQKEDINKKFKNMEIEVTHLKTYRRKHKFLKLTEQPANQLKFTETENGQKVKITVQTYFRRKYNLELKFPHFPCVHVHPETKSIFYPIEVCDLVYGQHCKKKLNPVQTAGMIQFTARSPSDRFNEIKDIRTERANFDQDNVVNGYEMNVYNEPLALEGRILNVPSILYKDTQGEKKVTPFNGAWDMRETKYFKAALINSWVLINLAEEPRGLDNFVKTLCRIAAIEGISINRPARIENADPKRSLEPVFRKAKELYKADFAIVVIPEKNNQQIYKEVKQTGEIVVGLVTQCIMEKNLYKDKGFAQLVSNLCQKINAKNGGVNNSLMSGELPPVMREPIIIIGADVTHPSGSDDSGISIAAAVASLDRHPSRYAVTLRAQSRRDEDKKSVEIIVDLQKMVEELLLAFYRNTNNQKPRRIVFYRDGVSEGEFEDVRQNEIVSVRRACKALQKDGYEPPITFIIVQKRHHVRFMPEDSRDGTGKMKNIPPGTTVDTVVTHPLNFDFFMCSHFGIQGTSRPCHYTVLHDDNQFSADDLQKLTFYLCHTYARCTRSISCPTPVMYADLAAYRARHYLSDVEGSTSSRSSGQRTDHMRRLQQAQREIRVIEGLANSMFFV